MEILWKDNDNLVEIDGLTNSADDSYVNNATVTLTAIKDAAGNTVSGATFPIDMDYVAGSDGKYQGSIPDGLVVSPGRRYTAEIDAISGALDAHWEVPLLCRVRTG